MCKSTIFILPNCYTTVKEKCIHANGAPFMSKKLHEAIMKRSRLRNVFLKHSTNTNKEPTAPNEISAERS